MTNREAINWLINVTADIGKVEHQDLWHYEQALSEIREMLESAPEPCKDAVSREAVLSDLKRWIGYLDEDMIERMGIGMKKLPSVQPTYTDEQIQKAQEMEQAQLDKAFELGREDAQEEIIRCKDCKFAINVGTTDMMCKNSNSWVVATGNNFGCVLAERRTDETD